MLYITGTPFSGISIAADYFSRIGLFTLPNADPKKEWISKDVEEINNAILKDNNLSPFDFISTSKLAFTGAHKYIISRLIRANPTIDFLVDPRFCATFSAWEKSADADYLICFRHPAESAFFLYDHFGFTITESLNIWRNHYQRVSQLMGTFLEFGSGVSEEEIHDNIQRCSSFIEIDYNSIQLNRSLQNHVLPAFDEIPVPAPIMKLYRLLVNRSLE